MHLRRLELVNFRRYRHVQVELPDGLVGFVGRNGAGKSTIVEALVWALYGHEAARTQKELIRNAEAAAGDECRVTLEFDLDGEAYRVTRRMRGASLLTDLVVESGNRLLVAGGANSTAQGTDFLQRSIGFDREAFLTSVVAYQGELTALSSRSPADRKRLIARMLGLDAIDEGIRLVRIERREAEVELTYIRQALTDETRLSDRDRELEAILKEAATTIGDAQGRLAELAQRFSALEAEQGRLQAAAVMAAEANQRRLLAEQRLHALRPKEAELGRAMGALPAVAISRDELRRETEKLRPTAASVASLEALRERFREADELARLSQRVRADVEALSVQAQAVPRLSERAGQVLVEAQQAGARTQALVRATADLSARISQGQSQRRVALEQVRAFEHRVRELEELGEDATCPMCDRPLAEATSTLRRKHEEERTRLGLAIKKLEEDEAAARRDLGRQEQEHAAAREAELQLTKTADALRRDLERARAAAELLSARTTEAKALDARRTSLGAIRWNPADLEAARRAAERVGKLENDLVRLEGQEQRRADLAASLAATRAEIAAAEENLRRSQAESALAAHDPRRLEATLRELASARQALDGLHRAEAAAGARQRAAEEERERLAESLKASEERRRRGRELEARVRILEFLAAAHGDKGFLPAFKTHLVARIRPALASAASDLLSRMTDGRYSELELDEDYNVSVVDLGRPQPLARFSGGETDAVSLALRLAINELVARVRGRSRLGFIALDEVFGSQDAERRLHILGALKGLGSVFRQVIVITHNEELQERLENVVRVIADGRSGSRLEPNWAVKDNESEPG